MSLTKPASSSAGATPVATTVDLRDGATPGLQLRTATRDERTIGQLVADISHELSGLVQAEIALAKAELSQSAKKGGIGAGLLVAAGVIALVMFVMLCITVGFGIAAAGLPYWAAFGIVTVALLLIAGVLAAVGRKQVKAVGKPQQTIDTTKRSIEVVKAAARHDG